MPAALEGRVALVTGGSRGLGAAYARMLVDEGARVVIGDLLDDAGEELARELGPQARFVHLDVTDPDQWASLASAVMSDWGAITILVNNAGVHSFGTVQGDDLANFRRVQDINVMGPFLGISTLSPAMAAAGGGVIVNVSSTCGIIGYGDQAAYVTSKWAVRGLTKAAAIDLAPDNIRVFVIVPGPFATPMTAPFSAELDQLVLSQPVSRVGDPREAAALVRYLCVDATYSSGAEFFVDGGAMTGMSLPDA
jgi:3alpha(or 20beta)-hydroxysteroid dehydrogenase